MAPEKIYYERNLPHWHPPGATFFLTYRLAGSIPVTVLQKIQDAGNEAITLAEKNLKRRRFIV
jgi:putative transposase